MTKKMSKEQHPPCTALRVLQALQERDKSDIEKMAHRIGTLEGAYSGVKESLQSIDQRTGQIFEKLDAHNNFASRLAVLEAYKGQMIKLAGGTAGLATIISQLIQFLIEKNI